MDLELDLDTTDQETDQKPDPLEDGKELPPETTDGKPYNDGFFNLSDDRKKQLRDVCDAMDARDEWARMIEIIRCTLRRYFLLGQQHPEWNSDTGMFQVGPTGVTLGEEDENQEEFFEEDFNIYKGFHDVFVSVFSQTAAPTRVRPANLSGEAIKATKEAEKYVETYEHFNPPKCAQRDVATLMWTDGRIIACTEFATDEEKCGVDEQGKPLGAEFTSYHGVLESKCPIIETFNLWPYVKLSREIDEVVAKHDNPKVASKIEGGSKSTEPNNSIARMSRIAVAEGITQVSDDTLTHLVTEDRFWLRPCAFRHLPDPDQAFWIGGKQKDPESEEEIEVQGIFPKGCRVKYLGTVFAGVEGIALEEQIKVMHANTGTGNARGSKSDSLIPVQMEFNDAMGMYSEMIHKCIPHTLVATTDTNLAAIVEQFSRYGEWGAIDLGGGRNIQEAIFQEQQIDVPASFGTWTANLQGTLPQQLANIQPAMFGGNMEDQKTAKAYQQAKDMSLGVMALMWVPYLEFKSGICWQAARLSAKRDNTKISVVIPQKNGKDKNVSLDTSVLGRGAFLMKPNTDQNFPESQTDIANKWIALFQVSTQNPFAAQIFQEPDNQASFKDATGLDIVIRGAAARDKQLAEWELMKGAGDDAGPVPDMEATEQKQQQKQQAADAAIAQLAPGTPAPAVPPEPPIKRSSVPTRLADDHIEEARTCVRILNDAKTLELLEDRPEVVEDLELHLVEHLTKARAAGIVIPPDMLAILPPAPLPAVPGLPGAPPAAAGGVPTPTPTPTPKPGAGAPPKNTPDLGGPQGGLNATATV